MNETMVGWRDGDRFRVTWTERMTEDDWRGRHRYWQLNYQDALMRQMKNTQADEQRRIMLLEQQPMSQPAAKRTPELPLLSAETAWKLLGATLRRFQPRR